MFPCELGYERRIAGEPLYNKDAYFSRRATGAPQNDVFFCLWLVQRGTAARTSDQPRVWEAKHWPQTTELRYIEAEGTLSMAFKLNVNGQSTSVDVPPEMPLLWVLR